MATLTIRNLREITKNKLRILAAQNGHSMEEEVRQILERAVNQASEFGLGSQISDLFAEFGGVELDIPQRTVARPPLSFDEDVE